ncbi:helix-turn-helix domain-containing protein [Nitratidesulfovibrio liaohensis]|uniref:helix-turn-helix domain-containing protein n=1 Tax=Nitratidesulfovibrio liaohensis TaxID=2604158 RepID=UPI00141EB1E9|nr:helix-turn-helix domain-containing protein [Nitratidesulfovibrio liaohensis]NHZ48618.1 helix-turn-helix domain-containing protein [Nitratidesulfovibrio liaohensis]
MTTQTTANAATRRCLRIVEILAGRVLDGLSNKELADTLGAPPPTISRDLAVLADIGWVQRLESGRWSLSAKPLQIAQAYSNHVERTTLRISELNQRIVAGALALGGNQ